MFEFKFWKHNVGGDFGIVAEFKLGYFYSDNLKYVQVYIKQNFLVNLPKLSNIT